MIGALPQMFVRYRKQPGAGTFNTRTRLDIPIRPLRQKDCKSVACACPVGFTWLSWETIKNSAWQRFQNCRYSGWFLGVDV